MSKRVVLLLASVAVVSSLATVTVMLARRPNTSSSTPYAYATLSNFVLMRGGHEVARVKRPFSVDDAETSKIAWTFDGRYVVFLSQAEYIGHRQDHPAMQLDIVDARTGALRSLPCPYCDTIAAVGGDTILALTAHTNGQVSEMRSFDVSTSKPGAPVDMSGLQNGQVDYNTLLAGAGGQVLVEDGSTSLDVPSSLYLMKKDGSAGAYSKQIPDEDPRIWAAAENTVYNEPEIAVVVAKFGTDLVKLIGPSGEETDINMSTVPPPPDQCTSDAVTVRDLWWGSDGYLRAVISAGTCNATPDQGATSSSPFTLYRLDGNRWVQEDSDPVLAERVFSGGAKAKLIFTNHNTQSLFGDKNQSLYYEQSAKRTLLADDVILILTPPPTSKPSSVMTLSHSVAALGKFRVFPSGLR